MEVYLSILEGILEQGLIYGIMALGIYITYSILDFPDLSVDGTFPLGAAVTALLISAGVNPWLAILTAFIAGSLAGLLTGIFHVVFGIKDLLSGIITMTGLYSINLMLAGGRAVLPIASKTTIFTNFPNTLLLIFLCALFIKLALDLYLKTKSGLLLRAVGDNASMVTMMGKDPGKVKILGLMLCNGLSATAGSILCQQQRSFDVNSGNGMLVMGLASVIIGISLFRHIPLLKGTTVVFLGSVLYKACLSVALNLNLNPNYLKLLMAVIFLAALVGNDMAKKGGKNHVKAGTH